MIEQEQREQRTQRETPGHSPRNPKKLTNTVYLADLADVRRWYIYGERRNAEAFCGHGSPKRANLRAGVVLITCDVNQLNKRKYSERLDILFVREKACVITAPGIPPRKCPQRMGIPKGGQENGDGDLYTTAARELYEETAINLRDKAYDARLSLCGVRVCSEYTDGAHTTIHYFVVYVNAQVRADIRVNPAELDGFAWVSASADILADVSPCNAVTAALLEQLTAVNLWNPGQLIDCAER